MARRLGYPVLVRPSYVLGGRAMVIAYDEEMVRRYMQEAVVFSQERPVLIDRFLEDATEVDVDALADQDGGVLIAGIMEHIEEAGVHSGDSSCVLPPQGLSEAVLKTIQDYTEQAGASAARVIGLMNVQYAIKDGEVYVLEVNPRASRTVPYVSKATGVPLPKIAVGLMLGKKLADFAHLTGGRTSGVLPVPQCFVKSPVFPFGKFPGVDPALGPEMRSTGEVMGVGENFGEAFGKAQLSAGTPLPESGHGVHQRERSRQSRRRGSGHEIRRTRFSTRRHARHRGGLESRRPRSEDRLQGERRPPQRGGPHEGRLAEAGDLHHHGRPHLQRRARHSPHRGRVPHSLHHHA